MRAASDAYEQLRDRRELERLAPAPRPGRATCGIVSERSKKTLAYDVREPARLAHERVAVQQHERSCREALDQRLEQARGARAGARGRRRRSRCGPGPAAGRRALASSARRARRRTVVADREVEPAAVGGDRLQRDEAVGAGASRPRRATASTPTPRRRARSAAPGATRSPRARPAPRQLTRPRGGGKPSSISSTSVLVARSSAPRTRAGRSRAGARTPPSSVGSQPKCAASARIARRYVTAGRDVRPLARVVALREQPAELVQRAGGARRIAVRVVVDERDARSVLLEVTLLLECLVSRGVGRPTRSGGRRDRSSASTGPSASVSTASAASASSASRLGRGQRRDAAPRALVLGERGRDRRRPARAARARARSRRGPRRSARRARGTGCSSRRRPSARRWSTPPRRRGTSTPRAPAPRGCRSPSRRTRRPSTGHDAVVGVEARRGQPAQAGQVLEHAGDERARAAESGRARRRRRSGCGRPPRARSARGRRCRRCRATASAPARRRAPAAWRRRGSSRAPAAARRRPAARARAAVEISCWPWPSSA